MFEEYSIKEKINFLKKIQDDVKFKQATFAKSLPDNFIFLNKSPFKGGLENFLENLNDESIEELAQSESGLALLDSMISNSIEFIKLNNTNLTLSLVTAQSDLIKVTYQELYKNPKLVEDLSKNIAALVSDAFTKGVNTATNIISKKGSAKSAETIAAEVLNDEKIKKSQDEILNILVSTAQDSLMAVFIPIMENIISNINAPDSNQS